MDVSIVGTGNVATVLGRLLKKYNHTIAEVRGRNKNETSELAAELEATSATINAPTLSHISLYIIAVSDRAITDVCKQIDFNNALIVHTAGAVAMEVLQPYSQNYGVLYPIQSLLKSIKNIPEIPFLIQANTRNNESQLHQLISSTHQSSKKSTDAERLQVHINGVIVNNFVNYMYVLSQKLSNEQRIDFSLLYPLILETAKRIQTNNPEQLQTGPAIRNDEATIHKHLSHTKHNVELDEVYQFLSKKITQHFSNNRST